MDIAKLYSRLDQALLDAQVDYEKMVLEEIKAREIYTDLELDYQKLFATEVSILSTQGHPVTIIKEIATLNTIEKKRSLSAALCSKKKYSALKDSVLERINTMKVLAKLKYQNLG